MNPKEFQKQLAAIDWAGVHESMYTCSPPTKIYFIESGNKIKPKISADGKPKPGFGKIAGTLDCFGDDYDFSEYIGRNIDIRPLDDDWDEWDDDERMIHAIRHTNWTEKINHWKNELIFQWYKNNPEFLALDIPQEINITPQIMDKIEAFKAQCEEDHFIPLDTIFENPYCGLILIRDGVQESVNAIIMAVSQNRKTIRLIDQAGDEREVHFSEPQDLVTQPRFHHSPDRSNLV